MEMTGVPGTPETLPLCEWIQAAVLEGGVLGGLAEAPRVVVAAGVAGAGVAVHVDVPVSVDAGVAGGRLELGGGLGGHKAIAAR